MLRRLWIKGGLWFLAQANTGVFPLRFASVEMTTVWCGRVRTGNDKGEVRGSLHCADDETVRSGRDDLGGWAKGAVLWDPTHRDETAMNGTHEHLVELRRPISRG